MTPLEKTVGAINLQATAVHTELEGNIKLHEAACLNQDSATQETLRVKCITLLELELDLRKKAIDTVYIRYGIKK